MTLKAHSLLAGNGAAQAADRAEHTTIVAAINGVPWWSTPTSSAASSRASVVEVGRSRRQTHAPRCRPSQVLGSIVYPATDVVEPGVIEHTYGDRFTLGEPDEQPQRACVEALGAFDQGRPPRRRCSRAASATNSGSSSRRNMAISNPISALTGATSTR